MGEALSDAEIKSALDACAEEPVHIPGCIQGHGALIGLDPDTQHVIYASENTKEKLGRAPEDVLGQTLKAAFDGLVALQASQGLLGCGTVREPGRVSIGGTEMMLTVSAAPNATILEFEPAPGEAEASMDDIRALEALMSETRVASSHQALFDVIAQMIKKLTGYDRVMVYQFDTDGNGQIRSEALEPSMEPYLGLNFPAWDIPAQARQIMLKTPLRYIAQVDGNPVRVRAASADLPDLDMTHAHLRGVSEVHMAYLRNMGSGATFTLNIKVQQQLWGIISLHHRTPRYPSQRIRRVCRSFAEVFSMQIELLNQSLWQRQLIRVDNLKHRINAETCKIGSDHPFEATLLEELRQSVKADGAALMFENQITTAGTVPEAAGLTDLLKTQSTETGMVATVSLSRTHPDLSGMSGDRFAGLLLSHIREDCTLAFFRKGLAQTVKWAGAPEKDVVVENGRGRLHPRGSFSLFVQNVTGTSLPWTAEEKRLAADFWSIFVAAERERLIETTNRQQSLIIDELNHRVRNILALIRSLSHQTLENHDSLEDYVKALDARIAAVAAAHDLGAEKGTAGATIKQIVKLESGPYNQETLRVLISGSDTGIKSEMAPMFALVIHELMTNAAKYGALSSPDGEVRVSIARGDDGVELRWQETGGPSVTPPQAKGFGSTLIEHSIPGELGGCVDVTFAEPGVQARIKLPESAVVDHPFVPEETRTAPRVRSAVPPRADTRSEKAVCLLVEDNYVVSLDTKRVLKKVGIENVEVALSVSDALEKLERLDPVLAILDINLSSGATSQPVADALQARGVPIIFVTGYGDTAGLGLAFRNYPVLKKPVREADLRTIVEEVLS